MKEMTIAEILTPKQLKEMEKVINQALKEKIDPLDPEFTKRLKVLFKPWAEELAVKEIDSDYLAYLVSYLTSTFSLDRR